MISYDIPGRKTIEIEHVVFDYNGTIAVDGGLIKGVAELINSLADRVKIYVLTADTYGSVREQCRDLKAEVLTFPGNNAGEEKGKIVQGLGGGSFCVGNGYNDIAMFRAADLSIAILEEEGASGKLLAEADLVSRDILEALEIILNANRVKASLRL